ncbi:MAG TPA: amino acid ABC transporter permease, partial [bacterium]|nr:amino acid ABC transporter permease [bacterium]
GQFASGHGEVEKGGAVSGVAETTHFSQFIPPLLWGAAMTLLLTLCAFTLAVLVGLPLALTRIYGPVPAQWLSTAYVEVMRGTPPLIQLLILYYGLPLIGLGMPAVYTAILGLGLNSAAYEAEVYRAAITSVSGGQMEAALSLGMSRAQALRWVILPQAFRIALPPSTNDFIALFKDSSLVSVITVVELTKTFQIFAAATYSYGQLGAMTAALYLMMSLPLAWMARRMERNLGVAT